MAFVWCRQTTNSHIAISNGLNLEHSTLLGNLVKIAVERLQKTENFQGFTGGCPCSESCNVSKHFLRVKQELGKE